MINMVLIDFKKRTYVLCCSKMKIKSFTIFFINSKTKNYLKAFNELYLHNTSFNVQYVCIQKKIRNFIYTYNT